MNCAAHPEVPASAFCRTCGKPLCEKCTHDVRGVIYCEDCIAARLQGTLPAAPAGATPPPAQGAPSPGLAAVLGFIPGVGAVYNGQYMKAFIHVLLVGALIWAADRVGIFGLFIAAFWFYMVFDAYKTAQARLRGEPLPDPFGLERFSGSGPRSGEARNAPIGAIILIGLGVLFFLDNIGRFHFEWVGRLWPLILIAIGIWIYARHQSEGACGCPRCRARCLMGPAILVSIGALALLSEFELASFHYTWPVILIVIGAVKILQSNAPGTGHIDTTGPAAPAGTTEPKSDSQQVGNA